MKPLAARFTASRPGRAWKRYAEAPGNILAAGVGYFAFFSIFPAAALALSVFGFVLQGHPLLLNTVLDQLSAYLPGLVQDTGHPKGLIAPAAPRTIPLTITGLVAFVALVLSGLGWLGAVRAGVRAVFGMSSSGGNLIRNTMRDLGVLFTLGLGIALVAVLTGAVGVAADWVAQGIGMAGEGWVLILAGLAVSVPADTALMIVLLRVVSGVSLPWRDLLRGALVGGVGFSLLKISGAALLPRLTANPLFASFAIVVGLLIWLNLIARLTLFSAAWAANDFDEIRGAGVDSRIAGPRRAPETAHLPVPGVRDSSLPTFGERSRDRITLGSGFILGAAALAAAGALARGARSMLRLARD
ncbi:MAG TPA: YihY/virulence factor BrkB family protein [Dermatophilaceae bacterium]